MKKLRERLLLDEAITLYPDFPTGTIDNRERPDFLIVNSSGVTGIELVDYVRGQTEGDSVYRRNEMLRLKITNTAKSKFESSHTDHLMIHFHWYPRRYLHLSEVNRVAADIAAIITRHIPTDLFNEITLNCCHLGERILSRYCHQISIMRVRDQTQVSWSSLNAGFVSVQPDEIQYLVTSKHTKISDYLANCDTIWLLIVADNYHLSSYVDLHNIINHPFKSQFNRVLFYDRINKKVKQLHTEWP